MVAETLDRTRNHGLRLEVVDAAHEEWPEFSDYLHHTGQAGKLLDENGWLSARQVVVAAFKGEKVVGHLGFCVEPVRADGKIILEACLDSIHMDTPALQQPLFDRAQAQARLLGCRSLKTDCRD